MSTPLSLSPATNAELPRPALLSQDAGKIQDLEARVQRLEQEAANHSRPAMDAVIRTEVKMDLITPRLRITSEKVKLFGSSHWVHTADKVDPSPSNKIRYYSLAFFS